MPDDLSEAGQHVLAYMRAAHEDRTFTLSELVEALRSSNGHDRNEVTYGVAQCQTRGLIAREPKVDGKELSFKLARVV